MDERDKSKGIWKQNFMNYSKLSLFGPRIEIKTWKEGFDFDHWLPPQNCETSFLYMLAKLLHGYGQYQKATITKIVYCGPKPPTHPHSHTHTL